MDYNLNLALCEQSIKNLWQQKKKKSIEMKLKLVQNEKIQLQPFFRRKKKFKPYECKYISEKCKKEVIFVLNSDIVWIDLTKKKENKLQAKILSFKSSTAKVNNEASFDFASGECCASIEILREICIKLSEWEQGIERAREENDEAKQTKKKNTVKNFITPQDQVGIVFLTDTWCASNEAWN